MLPEIVAALAEGLKVVFKLIPSRLLEIMVFNFCQIPSPPAQNQPIFPFPFVTEISGPSDLLATIALSEVAISIPVFKTILI